MLFETITAPTNGALYQFSAVPIPDFPNHRIAKDKVDNPALLLSTVSQLSNSNKTSLKLENVHVVFDAQCTIEQSGDVLEMPFTIVSFTGNDFLLKDYFLKLCLRLVEDLGNTPSYENVRQELSQFIELLRLAIEPPIKSIRGLWAELLVISESKAPSILLKCWHSLPEEKFDFNNGEERIEVKSCTGYSRIHTFSLDQLNSPIDTSTIIVSIFMRQASSGKSIDDLIEVIMCRVTKSDLVEKLQSQIALALGKSIYDSGKLKFDYEFARDSLRFYNAQDIPQISGDAIPNLVTDVHFRSDLSMCCALDLDTSVNKGTLFSAL